MLEPQDAAAPRSNHSAGKKPVACQHLAHMGRPGRQLNQQRGISWVARGMSEMLTAWSSPEITFEHSSMSILPTIGSTFTLLCGCVCTFTLSSELWSSCYMCRRAQFCPVPIHLSANRGWCLMCTLWQRYSFPKGAQVGLLFPHFTVLPLVQLPLFLSRIWMILVYLCIYCASIIG